jgi:hypothetical protein
VRGLTCQFVLVMGLLLQTAMTYAHSVTVMWDPNWESDLAGYKVYYRDDFIQNTNIIDVGNTTTTVVSNLLRGHTYVFAITAYNYFGEESDFSAEVVYTPLAASRLTPTINPVGDVTLNLFPPGRYGDGYVVPLSGIAASGVMLGGDTILTVTAVSSNPAIIPDPVVDYFSPNSEGMLKLNPKRAGSATITVVLSDGATSTKRSFVVTIQVAYEPFKLNVTQGLSGLPLVTVTWESLPGLIYRVLASAQLNLPGSTGDSQPTNWVDVSGFIVAAGTSTSWTDSRSLSVRSPSCFYVVELLNGPFRVKRLIQAKGEWVLSWESRPGLNYRVLWSAEPAPFDPQSSTWLDVSGIVTATGTTTSWTDRENFTSATPPTGFYTVELLTPQ